MNIKITGTGSSIPERIQPNVQFSSNSFFDATGSRIENPNEEIMEAEENQAPKENEEHGEKLEQCL